MAPLIKDLKLLWEVGIEAFDAYQQELFTLKAILLWTISDVISQHMATYQVVQLKGTLLVLYEMKKQIPKD